MSTISLRLPDSLHERIRKLAKKDRISINQFAASALAEKSRPLRRKTICPRGRSAPAERNSIVPCLRFRTLSPRTATRFEGSHRTKGLRGSLHKPTGPASGGRNLSQPFGGQEAPKG